MLALAQCSEVPTTPFVSNEQRQSERIYTLCLFVFLCHLPNVLFEVHPKFTHTISTKKTVITNLHFLRR